MAEPKEAKKSAPKKVSVVPVFGDMHHPYLDKVISGATEFDVLDNWLECQIEAGKLELI